MKLTETEALIATLCIGALLFLLRFLPFVLFGKRKTPFIFGIMEKCIPAISIAVLLVVCIKSHTTDLMLTSAVPETEIPAVASAVVASVVTVLLHLRWKNAMVSIFGGTILFMVLNYFL